MVGKVRAIPDGYEGATPYICCKGAAQALEFYQAAFGATERMRMAEPSGKIGHAEFSIGRAIVMLADEYPEIGVLSPQSLGGTAVNLYVYVDDVDGLAKRAEQAGATVRRPLANQFYGDRSVTLVDPFGHVWTFATHIEDVDAAEMQQRAAKAMGGA
ncbi:MAG: VOC family protein [Candidatus Binatia bacterium]